MIERDKQWNWLCIVPFFAIIAAVIPFDRLMEYQGIEPPARPPHRFTGKITTRKIIEGGAGGSLERTLMNSSYAARWFVPHYNEVVFRAIGRAPKACWLGRQRWLFTPPVAVEHRASRWNDLVEFDAGLIARVDQLIQRQGAELVVALIPDKARVYPEMAYFTGRMPPGKAAFLPAMVSALERRGVSVIDLTSTLLAVKARGEDAYLPDDHHWSSTAALAAARTIARELPPAKRIAMPKSRTRKKHKKYMVRWDQRAPSGASLVKKLNFWPGGSLEQRFKRTGLRARIGRAPAVKDFRSACATYWTTSFGKFGSPYFFANEVRCPVRIRMRAGGGSAWAPIRDLKRLRRLEKLSRHLIIWEIPEYHLHVAERHPKWPRAFLDLRRYLARRPVKR